jgi:hypothetical protein
MTSAMRRLCDSPWFPLVVMDCTRVHINAHARVARVSYMAYTRCKSLKRLDHVEFGRMTDAPVLDSGYPDMCIPGY